MLCDRRWTSIISLLQFQAQGHVLVSLTQQTQRRGFQWEDFEYLTDGLRLYVDIPDSILFHRTPWAHLNSPPVRSYHTCGGGVIHSGSYKDIGVHRF